MENPLKGYRVFSRDFWPFDIADISGVDGEQQRDWKRRGFYKKRTGDVMEVTRFFLVRTLREAGFDLAEAWRLANDEIVGWIVFNAAQLDSICDLRAGRVLRDKPNWRVNIGMQLTGRPSVAAGPLLAWGPSLKANLYPTYDLARNDVKEGDDAPVLIHTLDLSWLPQELVKRAGVIGYIEKVRAA